MKKYRASKQSINEIIGSPTLADVKAISKLYNNKLVSKKIVDISAPLYYLSKIFSYD